MWSAVGILLCSYAVNWVTHPATFIALALGFLGLAISVAVNRWGFSKLAHKNIDRILAYNERACAFAFQAWKGYLIIAIMMTGGILLRHSSIPRPYLAVVYAAIGRGAAAGEYALLRAGGADDVCRGAGVHRLNLSRDESRPSLPQRAQRPQRPRRKPGISRSPSLFALRSLWLSRLNPDQTVTATS